MHIFTKEALETLSSVFDTVSAKIIYYFNAIIGYGTRYILRFLVTNELTSTYLMHMNEKDALHPNLSALWPGEFRFNE